LVGIDEIEEEDQQHGSDFESRQGEAAVCVGREREREGTIGRLR
jgi:hypothetical protein